MATRRTSFVGWRSFGLLAVVALLVLPMTWIVGGVNDRGLTNQTADDALVFERQGTPSKAELLVAEKSKVDLYARPAATWWPEPNGKGLGAYGHVTSGELDSTSTLILPHGKGSFNTKGNGFRRNLPSELRASAFARSNARGNGKGQYFIVQLTPEAALNKHSVQIGSELGKLGIEIVHSIPVNGYLVRVRQQKDEVNLRKSGLFQFADEYAPSDKINNVGTRKLRNAERAQSDVFDVVIRVTPGEDPADVISAIERLGGTVVQDHGQIAGVSYISASIRNTRVLELAAEPAVNLIEESPEYQQHAFVHSAVLEMGRFLDPRDVGDFVLPFREAGVDGGGVYTGPAVNFKVAGSTGAPIAFSSAHTNFSVPPQYLGIADNGMTLDAPTFSHDNANPCVGACPTAGGGAGGVGVSHRKVEVYTRGRDVNNDGVDNDATATGDFLTCDSIRSGGDSHGAVVAGGAAGNPSQGTFGLGRTYEDQDVLDQFVAFFNDSREVGLPLDGQARGARVIFEDIANTPPSSPPGCAINFLSDVDAGDVPAARLMDMAFRRDVAPGATALDPRGAKVTLFSFGNPTNFDDNITNGQGNYLAGANSVDAFLFANRRVAHVQAIGNDGGDPTTAAKIDPFLCDQNAGDVTPACIQINDLATAKNIITVGTVGSDSTRATLDPSEATAFFSAHGPATFASRRGAPTVMAPGVDTGGGREGREGRYSDDYFISEATVVSFDNTNDTTGPAAVEDILIQGRAGTSVSAAHVAGAAVQVRDYFAKGFYPTGAATVSDRVGDMSGMLVKALLINSADFASQGLLGSCSGRGPVVCPSEEGYGKVELANTLPLQNYRLERRPPNSTSVAPISNVPQGLLVADEYFDGGMRGGGADGSASGIGVVQVGESVSFDFVRRHGNDQTRISLAWYDGAVDANSLAVVETETLQNDLDLTLISGDSDYIGGGVGICNFPDLFGAGTGVNPDLCGFCTYAANEPGSGAFFDAGSNNPNVLIFKGNQFRQFGGQFNLRGECDPGTGLLLTDPNELVDFPQNATDVRNTTESIMLHYFGDPSVFGATRSGGDNGSYRVRVSFKSTPSASPVPDAPAIAAGPNGVLNSTLGGDDTVMSLANGTPYVGSGANGIVNTTAGGDDLQLVDPGSFGQPFALAVAGPVFSQRVGSVISFDKVAYDCSDTSMSLRVADGSTPSTPASSVSGNTKVEVFDNTNTLRDVEAGFTFSNDAGSSALRISRSMHYNSNVRRMQFIKDRPGANDPIHNNGIVEVSDGWSLRATYDDQTKTLAADPALPPDAVGTARLVCKPIIGPVFSGVGSIANAIATENVRPTIVSGGCDVGRALANRGDFFFDAGEDVTYQVGFANQNLAQPVNLKATLSCADPVPGGANPCSFLNIVRPVNELGTVPAGREGIAQWTIHVDDGVKTLATADRAVDLKVTFDSRSTDFGSTLATQVFTYREAVQADMEILYYNTDYPSGGRSATDFNRDGIIRTLPDGSGARNRELITYQPLNNAGNPNAAIASQMPWRLDSNNGGFNAFRAADSKPGGPGSSQNALAWFYSTGGGCGWQTQNNGVVGSSATLPKGTWHAGHGPVGIFGTAGACPAYTNPTDPFTVPLTEFTADMLQSPEFAKVNPGLDARGIPFDVRMEAIGWNVNEAMGDTATTVIVEIDSNLDDSGPVILGDGYSYRPPFGRSGPRTGFPNGQRTFGPLRDSDNSLAGKVGVNGDEVGVSAPIIQRVEGNFLHRPLMAYPVADTDANTRGFQSNTAIDPGTGLPIIPGACVGSVCTAGADALIGTACATNAACTGPGTKVGHTTPWGPVRNTEADFLGSFEDFNGASGNRFQFEFQWFVNEGGQGALGMTIDDPYFEWSEQHPADQPNNSPNDCSKIGGHCAAGGLCDVGLVGQACTPGPAGDASCVARPGGNPNARQCGTVAFERVNLHNCTGGLRVLLTDSTTATTAGTLGCSAGQVPINVRSNEEPLGETFCLAPTGGGVFETTAQMSALSNQRGVLFVGSNPGENFFIVASYRDPECDLDNDGELNENRFPDVDGDSIQNFGADGFSRDVSKVDFLAEGQGSSDDDNCFNPTTLVDVYNPAGAAQRDNNGDGVVNATDCVASPRNGQCDFDDDGFGDLCDNCPTVANNNQLDTDADGIGNVCEDTDIDKDGRLNTADNCPSLYNPSQAGTPSRGTACDDLAVDGDNDGVFEANDNCPNEVPGGPLENGVLYPAASATYNPDQADTDSDGVGDRCDSEDFDRDGVPNLQDNCRTVYNPADPTFQIQTDSDLDLRGDDRQNRDTLPGPANYCDPDSSDDNNNGVPDDLVAVQSEVSCNFTASGISQASSPINALGSIAIVSVALSDDGTADFFCTAGDPNPLNDPALPEPCPQETLIDPNNDADCDTPGQPGTGVCGAVPDGTADPGEVSSLQLTLSNASIDRQTGGGRTLTNTVIGVRPTLPSVGCTPKGQTFLGTFGAGATQSTAPNGLTFIVDPANPGPGRSTAGQLAEAEFSLTTQADDMEGIVDQRFRFFVDVDRIDATPIAASCPSMPAMNVAGTLCEDFDTDRNATAGIQWTRLPISVTPTDPLRANGDPNDDILGFAQGTQASPNGTDGRACARSIANASNGCTGTVAEENDWHLHSTFEGPGAGYDPTSTPGINAPEGGKAHSGQRSMHMGRHLDASTTLGDTTRHRQVAAFVLDSQGDPNIPGVVVGPNSVVDFWQIVEFPDDEGVGSGFIPPGVTFGGAQFHISLLGSNGRFERWQRLTPSFNNYDSQNQATISICHYDPGDDQIAPNNETMCNLAPMWAELGGSIGTDATCAVDTDLNDPTHRDCGDVKSCPIPGGGANCTNSGSIGPGVWARSAFSLSPFAGRVARLRWIGASGGGWSFDIDRSFLEPAPGRIAYQYFDQDDGWWIDTIKVTDLRSAPAVITPDSLTGLSTCSALGDTNNCGVITPTIAGSVPLGIGTKRLVGQDALLQPVRLDARQTVAGDDPGTLGVVEQACANGVLQAQWSELDATGAVIDVLQPFSPGLDIKVAPSKDTTYRVDLKCSSDSSCTASRDVLVKVYSGEGSDLNQRFDVSGALVDGLEVLGGSSATLRWMSRPQPPGVSGYDVYRFTAGVGTGVDVFTGNTFDGVCFANAVAQAALGTNASVVDATNPAAGLAFMYQVSHSSNAAGALNPLGVRPASSNRAGQLVTAGVSCP